MPTTKTRYFGDLEYPCDGVLTFPAGLFGFESSQQFLLIEQPASKPLSFLQNLEDPSLCFLVMPAIQVDPGFRLFLDGESCGLLDLPLREHPHPPETLLCLAILNFDGTAQEPAANMQAPVVIHVSGRKGAQVLQLETGYRLRHPVPALNEVLSC